jgi:hypothetical protein
MRYNKACWRPLTSHTGAGPVHTSWRRSQGQALIELVMRYGPPAIDDAKNEADQRESMFADESG